MKTAPDRLPTSGAVLVETDGGGWMVSPSNRFGGYANTFPKGKHELNSRHKAVLKYGAPCTSRWPLRLH